MVIVKKYRVLISCPGDVYNKFEEEIIEAINDVNYHLGKLSTHGDNGVCHKVEIEPVYWGKDSVAEYSIGQDAQEVLNGQLIDDTLDGTIGIFYRRLGTPTARYDSGTIEEIEMSAKHGKYTAMLTINPFENNSIPQSCLPEYMRLYNYVEEYKNSKKGLYSSPDPSCLKKSIMDICYAIILHDGYLLNSAVDKM